jgi:NADH:ubiquinone oxidoreductase subunit 2 (subunit N)
MKQVKFSLYQNNLIELDMSSKYVEFNLILSVTLFAAFLTLMSQNFLLFFVGLEIVSICLYILVALTYEKISIEAALKYFFPGIFFSLFILLGIVFIYWSFGVDNFSTIRQVVLSLLEEQTKTFFYLSKGNSLTEFEIYFIEFNSTNYNFQIKTISYDLTSSTLSDFYIFFSELYFTFNFDSFCFFLNILFKEKIKFLLVGLSLIFFGLLAKLGLFPGNFIVLDVYGNTSFLAHVFLSIIPKIFYITLLTKFFLTFYYCYDVLLFRFIFLFAGIITLVYALFITLNQWKIKKFLASGSLVDLSYLAFLFYIMPPLNILEGSLEPLYSAEFILTLVLFYLSLYLSSVLFLYFILILFKQPTSLNNLIYLDDIKEFSLIKENGILYSIFFSFIFFSLAGVPPMLGFFYKFLLIKTFLLNNNLVLLVFVILSSIIALFYYIRVIRFIFFHRNKVYTIFIIEDKKFFLVFIFCFLITGFFYCPVFFNILFYIVSTDTYLIA